MSLTSIKSDSSGNTVRESGLSSSHSKSKKDANEIHETSLDTNSNYINDAENLDASKELIETFTKLDDLKSQEEVLEDWYNTMSDQLLQEQIKLKKNFQDMKLKILQQKQYYLKTSQEYINNLSSGPMFEGLGMKHESEVSERSMSESYGTAMRSPVRSRARMGHHTDYAEQVIINDTKGRESCSKEDAIADVIASDSQKSMRTLGMSPIHSPQKTPKRTLVRNIFHQKPRQGHVDMAKMPAYSKFSLYEDTNFSTPESKMTSSRVEESREKGDNLDFTGTLQVHKVGFLLFCGM